VAVNFYWIARDWSMVFMGLENSALVSHSSAATPAGVPVPEQLLSLHFMKDIFIIGSDFAMSVDGTDCCFS
jgi:hypothetical protein